jgi:bacterioferritin-associated ferredoxin
MYVCICRSVTDREIRTAVEAGTRTVRGLREQLGCTGQCGKCKQQVREIRDEVVAGRMRHAIDYTRPVEGACRPGAGHARRASP